MERFTNKISRNLLHTFNDTDSESKNEYMHTPIYSESNKTVYSMSPYICIKCSADDCVDIDIPDMSHLSDFFDEPEKKLENFEKIMTMCSEPTETKIVNIKKLSDLLDSIEKVKETEWVGEDHECPECQGEGYVWITYTADSNGKDYEFKETCPICDGSGTVGDRREIETGRMIIPYWVSVDFGFVFNIRSALCQILVDFCKELDIEEVIIRRCNSATFYIDIDDIRIIIAGVIRTSSDDYSDNVYKYVD